MLDGRAMLRGRDGADGGPDLHIPLLVRRPPRGAPYRGPTKGVRMTRLHLLTMWAAFGIGCASTIRVKETADGGQIVLDGDRRKTMELATPVMGARCGGPTQYRIVEDTGAQANDWEQGQWQLTYVCNSPPDKIKP